MARIVQKYGGTSVGSIERIQNVADRLIQTYEEGNQVVAVISAMSGVTDGLIKLAHEISLKPTDREMDVLLATGEQQSIALLSMALNKKGYKAFSFTGNQAGISTYGDHTRGRIATIDASRVTQALEDGYIVVCAGFQGVNELGDTQTLGRGGSDLSAIAMAQAVSADLCQIYTDVDGVYTCDPRIVSDAQKIPTLSYDEMLEMASSGSKVMQARSVEFAKKYDVVFEVRNSMNRNPGTIVRAENNACDRPVISITPTTKMQGRITVLGTPSSISTARLLHALGKAGVIVDMIVANTARDGRVRHSFTMDMEDIEAAKAALKDLDDVADLQERSGLSKISVVGEAMRHHPGVAAKMFRALAEEGIETGIISTSEIHISTTVAAAHRERAVHCLHKAFGLDQPYVAPADQACEAQACTKTATSCCSAESSSPTPSGENKAMESPVVNEVSRMDAVQARITISNIDPSVPYTSIILNALAEAKINIDMIVANTAYAAHARQSITMDSCDLEGGVAALQALIDQGSLGAEAQLETKDQLVKISAIGVGIRSHAEVAATIFQTLSDAQIKSYMISTSEINISTTVKQSASEEAINCLRRAFGLGADSCCS